MKVFLTGASGFIGRHLLEKLIKMKMYIICLSRKDKFEETLPKEVRDRVKVISGDIKDINSFDIEKDTDYVFHLAVEKKDKKEITKVNFEGTKNLLEKCKNKNIKKFVYFSSADVYGDVKNFPITEETEIDPKTYYAKSKFLAEQIVLFYNKYFPTVVIRPPAVYGEGDNPNSLTYLIFKQVKCGWFPIASGGNNLKEFCYVKNLVDGSLLCAESEISQGKIYLISDVRPYLFKEILWEIADAMQINLKLIPVPHFVAYLLQKKLVTNFYFSINKIKQELGYKPKYSLSEGVKRTVKNLFDIKIKSS